MINHFAFKTELGFPDPPLFAIIGMFLYGLTANIFYTGGWIVELLIRMIAPTRTDSFAYHAYLYGLIFSIFLTFSPALAALAFSLANAVKTLL
jgi:hypothetical protein